MNEKMFSLLMLTALIPAAQAIEPAPAPAPSKSVTINNFSAVSKENKTIVCSEISEIRDGLRLKFKDTTGANVVFYNDSANDLKLELVPAVPGLEANLANDSLYLRGEFQPETRYTIRVIGTLRAASGNTLKHAVALHHRTGALSPQLQFVTNGLYFTSGAKNFNLPYSLRTTPKYELEIWRLYDNNLDMNIYHDEFSKEYGEPIVKTTIQTPAAAKNKRMYYGNLDLNEYIKNRKKGVYYVSIKDPERDTDHWQYSGRNDSRMVIVTDLGISAVEDENRALLTVTSLVDGKAVAGAKVRAVTNKRQLVADGVTGQDGTVQLIFPKKIKESTHDRISHYIIEKGDDRTFFMADSNSKLTLDQDSTRKITDAPRAFVYGERDLFRPGEKVRISAFIRQVRNGKSTVLANAPVKFFLKSNSPRKTLDVRTVRTNEFGYATLEFQMAKHAALGTYSINCGLTEKDNYGTFTFKISNFMPDRIKVSLKPWQDYAIGAEPLTYEHKAQYYFGTVVENVSYRFAVEDMGATTPDHFKGWTVGNTSAGRKAKTFTAGGSKLPANSRLIWPGYTKQNGKAFAPVKMLTTLRVNEPGGRSVTAYSQFIYHPTENYIGIRKGSAVKQNDAAFEVKLLPALADKTPAEAEKVTWTLHRQEWEYVSRKSGDRYIREWELVKVPVKRYNDKVKFDTVSANIKQFVLPELTEGYYLLTVNGKDMSTAISFWHGEGTAGERSRDPNKLVVKTDKEIYQPGDTIKVTLPIPADSTALVTYGENKVEGILRRSFKKAGNAEIAIPIRKDVESERWYAVLTLISGKNNDIKRSFAFLKFKVDQKKHLLTPTLTCADKVKPGEKVTVNIALADGSGKPASGMVHVFAVDEGVLAITGYKAPDIFKGFYGPVYFNAAHYDNFGKFFPDLKLLPDGSIGGDKAVAAAKSPLRKYQEDDLQLKEIAAAFAPAIKVGKNGKGKVTLNLPDHTGAMRIMAVAASENAAGSAERLVTMRNAISLTLSAPNVVNPGDTFDVACSIFNHELNNSAYTIKVDNSAAYTVIDPGMTSGKLEKGKNSNFAIRCKAAHAPGKGNITVTFSMNGAVQKETIPLNVRIPTALERRSQVSVLLKGKSKTFTVKADEFYRGKHTLTISASPASSLPLALNYLNEYPYGCLEQTVSTAFPYLAIENLEKSGFLTPEAATSGKDRLELAIGNILSMQLSNGGFAWWPGSKDLWVHGSLYAAHFLVEVYNRKMPGVTKTPVQNALNWVESRLSTYHAKNSRLFNAYAGYVLAAGGRESGVQQMRNILSSQDQDFAAMVAALALIRGGYAAEGAAALQDLMNSEVWRKPEMLCGSVSDAAGYGMALYLLLENVPRHPEAIKIATTLAGKVRPDINAWGSTQANAWAALGLASFAADFPSDKDNTVVIRKDGKQTVHNVKTKLDIVMTPGKPVTVINSGKSVFAVRQTSEGNPIKAQDKDGAIKLRRMYMDKNGLPVNRVKHGEVVTVRIYLKAPHYITDLVICDILPAGLEIEDERLLLRSSAKTVNKNGFYSKYLERGVDRFLFFGNYYQKDNEHAYLEYRTRAVTRGVFSLSSCSAEAMYDPDLTGSIAGKGQFTVE